MSGQRILMLSSDPSSLVHFRGPMLRAWVAAGHEVHAASAGSAPESAATLLSWGIHYHPLPLGRASLNPLADLRALLAIRRLISSLRPEILFAYQIKAVVYGHLSARWAGVARRFAMVEGLGWAFGGSSLPRKVVAWLAGAMYRGALLGVDCVFFVNPDDREYFQARRIVPDSTRTVVLDGMGVDLARYVATPVPGGPPVFLLMARMLVEKGVRIFAEAARLVKVKYPAVRFQLLGAFDESRGGIPRSEIEGWVKEGVIEYLGLVRDIRPTMAAATVFVLPSYYREGLPQSSLEAIAMGRAVVTTDWPGCREAVIPEVTGVLVPPRDPAALATALERYCQDPTLATTHGAAGRDLAERRFDERAVVRTVMTEMGLIPVAEPR